MRGTVVSEVRGLWFPRDGQHRTGSKRGGLGPLGPEAAGLMRPVFSSTFRGEGRSGFVTARSWAGCGIILKGLILAQNERWRRGLGMQVERAGFGQSVAEG